MTAVRSAVAVGAATVALMAAAAGSPSYAEPDRPPHQVFTIRSPEITESSSLAVSTTRDGLVYTANDSSHAATVYVLDSSTGVVVGRTSLSGVEPVDIEAMVAGADGSLVVADIGDNGSDRRYVTVYRLEQPGRGGREGAPDGVRLTYLDGPRDAEAVLYDARSGRVFVVSKQTFAASIYATPPAVFSRDRAVLRPVTAAPSIVTDATFLPGGSVAVLRTYAGALLYRYPGWQVLRSVELPSQQQGESIAAPAGGRYVWVGSEGLHSDVLAVRLPPLPPKLTGPKTPASPSPADETPSATPTAEETASATSPVQAEEANRGWGTWGALGSILGVALAAGLVGGWLLSRRDRTTR